MLRFKNFHVEVTFQEPVILIDAIEHIICNIWKVPGPKLKYDVQGTSTMISLVHVAEDSERAIYFLACSFQKLPTGAWRRALMFRKGFLVDIIQDHFYNMQTINIISFLRHKYNLSSEN